MPDWHRHVRHAQAGADLGPRRRASSSPARTSGSRPPTTTRTAAAPSPIGSTRPTKANSARSPRPIPPRPSPPAQPGERRRGNSSTQPLANFHASGQPAADLVPVEPDAGSLRHGQPAPSAGGGLRKAFQGSLNTVGQAGTFSPWGTLEQGGNAVEWTDTITPPPFGMKGHRVWRRLHGGVPNAPVYQLWLSAIGPQPQKNTFFVATYPWLGHPDRRDRGPASTGSGS